MAKIKTSFFCQQCGNQFSKWQGRCTACGEWNTIIEESISKEDNIQPAWNAGHDALKKVNQPQPIQSIEITHEHRLKTNDIEFDRVLGGGIVAGSLVLIGGEPGIGKSTLLLQLAIKLRSLKVLYVSGEESGKQIRMRAERMNLTSENCFILTETATMNIFKQIEQLKPGLVVIDSIQTLHSNHLEATAGSISQVKYCAGELMKFAKETNTPVFLIGHITKDGALAGPKVLEHMVDTVLQFEGDRHLAYRILRTTKNRFGSTSELGIYEMRNSGLREVNNPSEILLSQKDQNLSGVAIGATLEGNRPLLIEIQSLVSTANYGTPQRSSTGFDSKRLNMLLAVLEKRGGFRLGTQDVFLNVAGGFKVEDPAMDLAVCMSIISSMNEMAIADDICFAAEVGLGGEIRAVNRVENRISEAEKLGFKEIYISKFNLKGLQHTNHKIALKSFSKLDQVISTLMG